MEVCKVGKEVRQPFRCVEWAPFLILKHHRTTIVLGHGLPELFKARHYWRIGAELKWCVREALVLATLLHNKQVRIHMDGLDIALLSHITKIVRSRREEAWDIMLPMDVLKSNEASRFEPV